MDEAEEQTTEIETPEANEDIESASAMDVTAPDSASNTGAPPANMRPPHAASMSRTPHTAMSSARRIMAACGTGEHEMFLVRPNDRIEFSGTNGAFGLRAGVFRTRVQTQEDAITRCFRGKYIRRGQDVHLTLGADGHVDGVRVREWCPVPPEARRCTQRALTGLDFSDLGPTRTAASFSFDIEGL